MIRWQTPPMGNVLVVSGPPGAGKSVVATAVAHRLHPSILVPGDSFFGFLVNGGLDPWLPEAYAQNVAVLEAAASATGCFVRSGYNTIYDGVLGPWFVDAFAHATGLDGIHYSILLPSVETCVARVLGRHDHRFTDEAVTRQLYLDFVEAGIESRHLITSAESPSELADKLLRSIDDQSLLYRPARSCTPRRTRPTPPDTGAIDGQR